MPLFPHPRADRGGVGLAGAGGSVWCAPGFDALKFFGWMRGATHLVHGVPTMHQAILSRAGRNAEIIAERRCASCARPRPRCRGR
jgi:hypothetical protein